jgi:hypothetical protein
VVFFKGLKSSKNARQKVKVIISKIKKVLTNGGVDGIAENIILPVAMLPVKNIKSCRDFFI